LHGRRKKWGYALCFEHLHERATFNQRARRSQSPNSHVELRVFTNRSKQSKGDEYQINNV
jgi:hypothetical protein